VQDGASDAVPSPLEYKESVERASEEIVSNLRVALTHPRFEAVRVDLTGGMDARLIFAALTHLTEFNAKVGLQTSYVPSSPDDLKISLALTRNYPFGYDEIPRVVRDQSMPESVLPAQSMNLGAYYGIRPERVRSKLQNTLRINGFYGEVTAM